MLPRDTPTDIPRREDGCPLARSSVLPRTKTHKCVSSTVSLRVGRRALQALNLFNSRFTMDESTAFAARVEKETGSSPGDQVRRVYQLAYGREPDADELKDAASLVADVGLPALCRAVYNSSEFLFIP